MANFRSLSSDMILNFLEEHPLSSSRQIFEQIEAEISYASVKRNLQSLLKQEAIEVIGKGKSSKYRLKAEFHILYPVDMHSYFEKDIDERTIRTQFNFELIRETLKEIPLFTQIELDMLMDLNAIFQQKTALLSETEKRNEFERLAIDLSWKSSQIEGNTYSLLETERLLKDKKTASGKTKDEASMLLNHKAALDFILLHPNYVKPLTPSCIEDIHSILIQELPISRNIRTRKVGISGTNYVPPDNEFQIKEAMIDMCALINRRSNVFEKALLVLLLISYIQPFTDGNKRTARIISNALLMQFNYCPMSFRTVDVLDYKKAMLIFYEQNNISAFKKIFIEQFVFAVNHYY